MIFASTAPSYYAAGLQVIPLRPNEKRPFTDTWQRYSNMKVSAQEQNQFIASAPNGNIGLVLGQASGVIVVDIDLENPDDIEAVIKALPFSPWHRRGKKGMMLAYKYSPIKTCRIKSKTAGMLVEFLTSRVQCVLPPSIHPETRQPYTSNCNLFDVLDQLVELPADVEDKIRVLLQSRGYELSMAGWTKVCDFVSSGSRDTELTKRAGLMAFAVMRGEKSLKDAIDMLVIMANDFTEKVVGDDMDIDKHISNLVKFIMNDVRDRNKVLPIGWDNDLTDGDKERLGLDIKEEERAWEVNDLRKWIIENGRLACGNEDAEYAFIDKAISFLCRSTQLSSIQIDQMLNTICGNISMKMKPAGLKARMKEMRQGELQGQDQTEVAQHVISQYRQVSEIRFDSGRFYIWEGSHWEYLTERDISTRVSRDYGNLPVCKRANDIMGVIKVMSMNCSEPLSKGDVSGVNFANGFLTDDMKLIDHSPDFGCTYTLPYRYLPEEAGNFPRFWKFLQDSWGKESDFEDRVAALQEMMAVTLFGEAPQYQKVFLLQGAGKSGKSQLLRIIEELIPEIAKCAVPPEDWTDKFMPLTMLNKLLNVCGELSETKKLDGKKFKEIADGSKITSQYKFGDFVSFNPTCAQWFCSNHYPKTNDTSTGFIRRWLILTFKYAVAADKVEVSLGEKIVVEEREAICAWAAQAIGRVRANSGYTIPASHKEVINRIANANNSVRDFICNSRNLELKAGVEISEADLYSAYWDYCIGTGGRKPESDGKFREIMAELASEFGVHVEHSAEQSGLRSDIIYVGISRAK